MSTMTTTPYPSLTLAPVRDLRPVRTSPQPGPAQLRLTRRGRVVVLLATLLVALAVGVFFGAGSVASEQGGTPEPTRMVMVSQGETLWGIASEVAGDGSTREMVSEIEQLNALDTAMVTAGQKLRVPIAK